jgi:hypothetical protein|mmetsp:Transcript_24994/g.42798  ORF Transcript_24994/g.42798 Transcript_24994/m.42798 type:complete len:204 (+) Transcript_24994:750-1361(+)
MLPRSSPIFSVERTILLAGGHIIVSLEFRRSHAANGLRLLHSFLHITSVRPMILCHLRMSPQCMNAPAICPIPLPRFQGSGLVNACSVGSANASSPVCVENSLPSASKAPSFDFVACLTLQHCSTKFCPFVERNTSLLDCLSPVPRFSACGNESLPHPPCSSLLSPFAMLPHILTNPSDLLPHDRLSHPQYARSDSKPQQVGF